MRKEIANFHLSDDRKLLNGSADILRTNSSANKQIRETLSAASVNHG